MTDYHQIKISAKIVELSHHGAYFQMNDVYSIFFLTGVLFLWKKRSRTTRSATRSVTRYFYEAWLAIKFICRVLVVVVVSF